MHGHLNVKKERAKLIFHTYFILIKFKKKKDFHKKYFHLDGEREFQLSIRKFEDETLNIYTFVCRYMIQKVKF